VHNRWAVLTVLFAARFTMAFQFQSVAALAPILRSRFDIGAAELGVLIGLYFPVGIALALAGGAIGRRYGDKRCVIFALAAMLAGELVSALDDSWRGQIMGRLVAGAGGVLLNVQVSKMVTDWFAGREIATAMAIFVNSWPAGVATSLILLPIVGSTFGLRGTYLLVSLLIVGAVVLVATYRSPAINGTTAMTPATDGFGLRTLVATIVAGLIWGCFNIGLTRSLLSVHPC
jgi:predicted MFS family arabinose efflux permease